MRRRLAVLALVAAAAGLSVLAVTGTIPRQSGAPAGVDPLGLGGKPATLLGPGDATSAIHAVPPLPPSAGRDAAAEKSPAGNGSTSAAQPSQGGGSAGPGGGLPQTADRMIVYNTTMSLEVPAVSEAVASVRALADRTGAVVAAISTRFQGEAEYASLTLRVPVGQYNHVMSELRGMAARVASENGNSQDVTDEYTDLGAQLRNLEATEARYLELLQRANSIDDILKVQARLTDVRGQIERLQGRMKLLERTTDMATIVVNLAPLGTGRTTRPQPTAWDPARSVQEAWDLSLRLIQAVADVGIRAAVFCWWLAPIGLVVWLAWAAVRRPRQQAAP